MQGMGAPFWQPSGPVVRGLSGIAQYDTPGSFSDAVQAVRTFDASGLHPQFVDRAGNMSLESRIPGDGFGVRRPSSWYRPNMQGVTGRLGTLGTFNGYDRLHSAVEDEEHYPLTCNPWNCQQGGRCGQDGQCRCPPGSSGAFCQYPGMAPRRWPYQIRGQ